MKQLYRKILSLQTHYSWPAAGANPVALGKDAKVVIYGTIWGVRNGTITPRATDHEVGDTEDAIYGTAPVGTAALTASAPPYGGLNVAAQQQSGVTAQGTVWAFEAHQPGRMVADVSIVAFLPLGAGSSGIPAALPLSIMAGQYVTNVMVFLRGKASLVPVFPQASAWNFPYLLCVETPQRLDINQPTEITLTGKSSGVFVGPSA
jgi:hypothetical protein